MIEMPKHSYTRLMKRKFVIRLYYFFLKIFFRQFFFLTETFKHSYLQNGLCLVVTGSWECFLKYKSKWKSAVYNLYTYEIKALIPSRPTGVFKADCWDGEKERKKKDNKKQPLILCVIWTILLSKIKNKKTLKDIQNYRENRRIIRRFTKRCMVFIYYRGEVLFWFRSCIHVEQSIITLEFHYSNLRADLL